MAFRLPTRLSLAPGSFALLPEVVPAHARVVLVFDAGLAETPWPAQALSSLESAGCTVVPFNDVAPNPRLETIDNLAGLVRSEPADVVVALGGGSVLDAGKAVAMLAHNPGSCARYEGKNLFSNPSLPFIAIPTTCGTGSEVTWVSVISHEAERRKISVKGDGMFPTHALVDADLLTTLPAHLVAYTGMDALTHALEAYTGTQSNPVSDVLAEEAITLLFTYLRRAHVNIAGDTEAREAVMRASTLAGIAFSNADVAGVHCLSETLGGLYDVPHGLANAMLLAPVLRSHGETVAARLSRLLEKRAGKAARGMPASQRAEAFLQQIEAMTKDLEIPRFATLKVPSADYPMIARGAVTNNSNGSNPRTMDEQAYLDILKSIKG